MRIANVTLDNPMLHITKWLIFAFLLLGVGVLTIFVKWYILIPLLLGLVIAVTLFIRFEWGMYLLIFLVPFTIGRIGFVIRELRDMHWLIGRVDRISIFSPIIIISFLGIVFAMLTKRIKITFKNPFRWPLFILLFYAVITLAYTPHLGHSAVQLCALVLGICLYSIFIYTVDNENIHKRIMWCWVISIAIQSLILLSFYFFKSQMLIIEHDISKEIFLRIELFLGYKTPEGFIKRGTSFAYPQDTPLIMNLALATALGLVLVENKIYRKVILIIMMALFISANLLTMSRAGTGSLLIMVFFIFVILRKYRKHLVAVSLIFLISTITIFQVENLLLNAAIGRELTPRILVRGIESVSSIEKAAPMRVDMWSAAFDKLKDTMLLGMGIGNFQYYIRYVHAHSVYFSFLFDFGLIGLGVLIYFMIILCKRFFGILRFQSSYLQIMSVAIFGGFIAIGIHGLVDFGYDMTILWLYFGMGVATLNLVMQELQGHAVK